MPSESEHRDPYPAHVVEHLVAQLDEGRNGKRVAVGGYQVIRISRFHYVVCLLAPPGKPVHESTLPRNAVSWAINRVREETALWQGALDL